MATPIHHTTTPTLLEMAGLGASLSQRSRREFPHGRFVTLRSEKESGYVYTPIPVEWLATRRPQDPPFPKEYVGVVMGWNGVAIEAENPASQNQHFGHLFGLDDWLC